MTTGTIKYAKLDSSQRLQRVHALLSTGKEYTTLQIIQLAKISSVSVAITELRRNDMKITCRMIAHDPLTNSRTYGYQLKEAA